MCHYNMLSFVVAEYKYCNYELYKNIKNYFENTKRVYWWAEVQVVHSKSLWGHIQGSNGDSQQEQRLNKLSIKKQRVAFSVSLKRSFIIVKFSFCWIEKLWILCEMINYLEEEWGYEWKLCNTLSNREDVKYKMN